MSGKKSRSGVRIEHNPGDTTTDATTQSAYLPIAGYGVIGNLRTVALVGRNGSIDWCCFPDLDRPSVFGALLDAEKGGRFQVAPAAHASRQDASANSSAMHGDQEYLTDTNILLTRFGRRDAELLTVTDFMPLRGEIEGPGGSQAPPEIHRVLECPHGSVEVDLQWAPRFDYARERTRIRRSGGGFVAEGNAGQICLSAVPEAVIEEGEGGQILKARFVLEKGTPMVLVTRWDSERADADLESTQLLLEETSEVWQKWVQGHGRLCARDWAGRWLPFVNRASLVFKLLTNADTGAIAAAATTSLPEEIGGVRNWDYRYAWIRDAAMTAQALVALGHEQDATALVRWMEEISARHEEGFDLRVMYGLHGEDELAEEELDHLEGYCRSKPVRIGNEAAEQFQLEVFGELIHSAYEMARRGTVWEPKIRQFIRHIADHTCSVWKQPDYGIWEMRNGPAHFTYSKMMAWVALDRAARLVEQYDFQGDVEAWFRTCGEIREEILAHGYNEQLGAFVTTFDSDDLDAALLRIPLMEFLPVEDPRVERTVERIMEHLMTHDLVYRYRLDDGLPGEEGAFGICTFWLIDVLSLAGRTEEAARIFQGMLDRGSALGLFSEEIDPKSGAFLGNYPQAFTHIGLINSALYLSWAQGQAMPDHAPIGTQAHRERGGKGNNENAV